MSHTDAVAQVLTFGHPAFSRVTRGVRQRGLDAGDLVGIGRRAAVGTATRVAGIGWHPAQGEWSKCLQVQLCRDHSRHERGALPNSP